ncbi:MAG: cupredoxin family copper-binding protein [Candidatus Eremiobacteraeota bacterium]|nr:cupredoxin family copper-binding protein [Candidatus Eremiobacteraeota bacterium]
MIARHISRLLASLAVGTLVALAWPAPGARADAPPSPSPTLIVIRNYAFMPASITIKTGSTVQWRNDDSVSHTATAADGTFDSKNLDRGQTYTFTFAKAGTYAYTCSYHPNMTGKIVVSDTGQ